MGRRGAIIIFISILSMLWVTLGVCAQQDPSGSICAISGCNCTKRAASWKVVNCTFNIAQVVTFHPGSIQHDDIEIFITGGQKLIFQEKAFNSVPGLSILLIRSAQQVVIEKRAFFNLTSVSLRLQIENCDRLTLSKGAFENSQGLITSEISSIAHCSVETAAFSKLLNATFQDIQRLDLSERAFEFNKQTANGNVLVTKITFVNVNIPKIPRQTFCSSTGEITFRNCNIDDIQAEALTAQEISGLYFFNSTIGVLRKGAFKLRTLVLNFRINKCNISRLESKAVMCAMNNLTIQHSSIVDIEAGAINITAAQIFIIGNQIVNFHSSALVFENWNKILVDQNLVKNLEANFISGQSNLDTMPEFSFVNNDVVHIKPEALNIISTLEEKSLTISNNFFNETCHCSIKEWIDTLSVPNKSSKRIMSSSFCYVNDLLSRCFELQAGLINMMNFTELVCGSSDKIQCEHYNGETKVLTNATSIFQEDQNKNTSWLILILTVVGLFIIAILATFIFLLISGGRWLKKKGYFRNMHYNQNEQSNEEENTIVTIDETYNKLEVPEELTLEFLEYLKKRLDDPSTHQETSEMIERLYEMFIVEDNYENNNRQDEEAHLYEELANMQTAPANPDPDLSNNQTANGPRSILRLMEERFNLQFIDSDGEPATMKPSLVGDYAEPSDAAVHLYSELKQKNNESNDKKHSLKSNCSGSMSKRPLPNKPSYTDESRAGPSSSSHYN